MNATLVAAFILILAVVAIVIKAVRTRNPHHKSIKAMATNAARKDFYFKMNKYYYHNSYNIKTYALIYEEAYTKAYAKAIKYGVN